MRLRRFSGPDTATAVRRVKEALGSEAVILATRVVPEGGIEITAAVDADLVTDAAAAGSDAGLDVVVRELRELGASVRRIDRMLRPTALGRLDVGAEAHALAERLALQGLAMDLAGAAAASFEQARRDGAAAGAALETSLAQHLLAAPRAGGRVTAFVGPTGHGKTTTIAKLAAARARAGRARVGLVMADTYRVGAAEQLGAYARLLGVPIRVARDRGELGRALAAFADHEAVYVDTAGLGGDAGALPALRDLLAGAGEPVEVTAVVSAGASERALAAAGRQLADLGAARCVVTKVDESAGLGAACAWLRERGLALEWLGTGQRVPDDLTAASGSALVRWLVAA